MAWTQGLPTTPGIYWIENADMLPSNTPVLLDEDGMLSLPYTTPWVGLSSMDPTKTKFFPVVKPADG